MPKVSRVHLLDGRSERSGMLIGDPLVEGSNAGSTKKASDLSQSSGGRRNSDAQTGAACS